MTQDQQPRERLCDKGASALSDAELLAIIFRTGSVSEDVLELADSVLDSFGGLAGLCRASLKELMDFNGIGLVKASSIMASIELGRRMARSLKEEKDLKLLPWRVKVDNWRIELSAEPREFIVAIFTDEKDGLIDEEKISFGGLDGASMDIVYFLRKALRLRASGVVLLHNHPNGTLESSLEDRLLTDLVQKKLDVLGITFLGHFIVSSRGIAQVETK